MLTLATACDQSDGQNKSIIYGLRLGMEQSTADSLIRTYASEGRLSSSKTFLPYETVFGLGDEKGELSFRPVYMDGVLQSLEFEACFKAWAPWNREMFSDDVIKAMNNSNTLWPDINWKTERAGWQANYRGYTMTAIMRDEKYIKGKILQK